MCSLLMEKKHIAYVITVSDTAGYRKQSDMLSQDWLNLKSKQNKGYREF